MINMLEEGGGQKSGREKGRDARDKERISIYITYIADLSEWKMWGRKDTTYCMSGWEPWEIENYMNGWKQEKDKFHDKEKI